MKGYGDFGEVLARDLRAIVGEAKTSILANHPDLLTGARANETQRGRLRGAISQFLIERGGILSKPDREGLAAKITDEMVGYGPIDGLLKDPRISEVMVNGPNHVFVEIGGVVEAVPVRFRDEDHLLETINRMVAPLGRRIDQSSPYVDARLPDGSRANAIIPPISLTGPVLTVRKFSPRVLGPEDLLALGTLSGEVLDFLKGCVEARLNVLVSGGASSGKTTTLNALSSFVEKSARVITIEDSAELRLLHGHVIALEARMPNLEGRGEVTLRQLLRNALRMRPDRIIVGEVRGAEAFDMLQAMNTGHEGSLSTIHANTCLDALRRLETMAMMAGEHMPHTALREQVRSAIDVVLHQVRLSDGSRRVQQVCLVMKDEEARRAESHLELREIFRFRLLSRDEHGHIKGEFEQCPFALPAYYKERLMAAAPVVHKREAS